MDGETNYKMTDYYAKCLEKGLQYQDFIANILINELGISLTSYSSKKYQYDFGENKQGFEIKFDDMYKKTGNIYIEVKEKSNPNNINYVDSGIYREDNTWLYLIGDYVEIFIFSTKYLRMIYKSNKFEVKQIATSIGFIIPKKDAEKYCIKKIELSDIEKTRVLPNVSIKESLNAQKNKSQ